MQALLLLLIAAWTTPLQSPQAQQLQSCNALVRAGKFSEGEQALRELLQSAPNSGPAWMLLGHALYGQKRYGEALPAFEKASSTPKLTSGAAYSAGCMAALIGETDLSFSWLTRAVAAGFADGPLLATDTDLDSIRSDPRFGALLPPMLEGSQAFVEKPRVLHTFIGEASGDQFGWVVRNLGDLDGDGVMDFATSAPTHSGLAPNAGRVYVYSSKRGKLLFKIDGQAGMRLGASLAGHTDFDGDGTPDILAGAPGSGQQPGFAQVHSGRDGSLIVRASADEAADGFGTSICGSEDLDGDGRGELIVGATKADAGGKDAGCLYVYSSKSRSILFQIPGANAGDQFGSAAHATQQGGERLLAVGAAGSKGGGRVLVYRCNKDGAEFLFAIEPETGSANLGYYFVSMLGDVDGDGASDVYASDFNHSAAGPNAGRVYAYSSATGKKLLSIDGHRVSEGFGTSSAVCGDVNADGHADMIVGAWQHASVAKAAGRVYVHSGSDGSLLQTWTSRQAGDTLGFDAAGIGDVDGDGAVDFLLTSAWSAVRGAQTGRIFLVAGPKF